MQLATCNMLHACNLQHLHATCDMRHAACNMHMQHATSVQPYGSVQRATCNAGAGASAKETANINRSLFCLGKVGPAPRGTRRSTTRAAG